MPEPVTSADAERYFRCVFSDIQRQSPKEVRDWLSIEFDPTGPSWNIQLKDPAANMNYSVLQLWPETEVDQSWSLNVPNWVTKRLEIPGPAQEERGYTDFRIHDLDREEVVRLFVAIAELYAM